MLQNQKVAKRMVWNLEGIVPILRAEESRISLLCRLFLSGAYNMCFLNFHHQVVSCFAKYICCVADRFIAASCRMCARYRCHIRMPKISTPSKPKLHHRMILKRLLRG